MPDELTLITHHLCQEMEIQAILCYGSYGQSLQDEKSDIDLLVIAHAPIPTSMRANVYAKLPKAKILELDKNMEGWDVSWTPVNDRLQVGRRVIEIGYNTTEWVDRVVENLIVKQQISFGFRPYTFLGLLESSVILYDRDGFIKKCKARIRPMPKGLKNEIMKAFLPVLEESTQDLVDCAERNIGILAFQFYLCRALDAAIQLLFAINEVYDPASKRTEPFLWKLKKKPESLAPFIHEILPRFYEKKQGVVQFFEETLAFINDNIE